jgi:hypothetical protein
MGAASKRVCEMRSKMSPRLSGLRNPTPSLKESDTESSLFKLRRKGSLKGRWIIGLAALGSMLLLADARSSYAQNGLSVPQTTTLWVDESTGQLFVRPGHGRVPMTIGASPEQLQQQIQQQTSEKVQAAVAQSEAQQHADNVKLAQQVAAMQPAWHSYLDNFQSKFRIGALAYLDYGYYSHTGFGPQWLENMNPPGVGNNGYNAFDINRVYLNTYFTPLKDWTFRFTPEIYRAVGTASNDKNGTTTGVGTNLDGPLNVRLKFAYLQWNGLWNNVPLLKGGNVTLGAQQNPLLSWEDDLLGYRFVYLTPWNYLGLSSSAVGVQFNGGVQPYGPEVNYLDYSVGVFNNGSFRSAENTDTKQVMGRATYYPFGAKWRYQGLGLTGFYDYGYGNVAPDSDSLPTPLKVSNAHFDRAAAILSYAAQEWNAIGEFDYGDNAFTLANLYSGSGPLDAFGTATGTALKGSFAGNTCSLAPCYGVQDTYGPQVAAYQAFLNNGRSRQIGFDLMGHYHIPDTKLTAFGMFQWFMPNDNVAENPLDFEHWVAGISYQVNEYVRLAVDSQNLSFYHSQFGLPVSYLSQFNYVPGGTFNGRLLPKTGSFVIPNMVPRDMHTIFLNLEFAY